MVMVHRSIRAMVITPPPDPAEHEHEPGAVNGSGGSAL